MCARYTIRKKTLREVADALDAEDDEPLYRARFNLAPTDQGWIVEYGADRRVLRPATWNYLVRNARGLHCVRDAVRELREVERPAARVFERAPRATSDHRATPWRTTS